MAIGCMHSNFNRWFSLLCSFYHHIFNSPLPLATVLIRSLSISFLSFNSLSIDIQFCFNLFGFHDYTPNRYIICSFCSASFQCYEKITWLNVKFRMNILFYIFKHEKYRHSRCNSIRESDSFKCQWEKKRN